MHSQLNPHALIPSRMEEILPKLNDDMLIQIMARSPDVRTLANMRTMSKSLNTVSYASTFTSSHTVSGFLFQFLDNRQHISQFIDTCASECSHQTLHSLDFLPLVPVKTVACSDATGLVYCTSSDPQSEKNPLVLNHYVCKPATREWIQIPNPKTRHEHWYHGDLAGLVVVRSTPIRFMIIRLSQEPWSTQRPFTLHSYKCQVFDSDHPDKWRTLKKPFHLGGYTESLMLDTPVTVNGNIHFTTSDKRVAGFNPVAEKWEVFSLPESCRGDFLCPKLLKYKGKLALVLREVNNMSMLFWVMEDYASKVWTPQNPICLIEIGQWQDLMGFCASDVGLFKINYSYTCMYNVKKNCKHGTKRKRLQHHDYLVSVFETRSDFQRLGWKTEADAKGYKARQQEKAHRKWNLLSRSRNNLLQAVPNK